MPDTASPIRLFLSHTSDTKTQAVMIGESLKLYGISPFIAHEHIEPSTEWQAEIEKALLNMDVLVALLTESFKESDWTDQEVGAAIGRQVPVFPVSLGRDPYGFIAKYQAVPGLSRSPEVIAQQLAVCVWKSRRLKRLLPAAYTLGLRRANSFDEARRLAKLLPLIERFPKELIGELVSVYNGNRQIYQCYEFTNNILGFLSRIDDEWYDLDNDGLVFSSPF